MSDLAGELAARARFAVEADEFRALDVGQRPPLLGRNGDTILPAGGLVVVAGQPGVGKTTLLVDLVYHLASGIDWLGIPCPRPLSVLLIENEGPQDLFAAKIDAKATAWPHDRPGRVWVKTWHWGTFNLTDRDDRGELVTFLREHPVDAIVGDPLGSLGPAGVGSPEDTRRFVGQLYELELDVAYIFVHHFRKEPIASEVDQLSGAWAGHLDTLMLLKPTRRKNEVRLSFPKTRWAEQASHAPLILGYVRATQGFDVLGEEGDPKLLEATLVELLEAQTYRTPSELAKDAGARRTTVEACLTGNAHLFTSVAGADVGRTRAKTVWQLVPDAEGLGQAAGQAAAPHGYANSPASATLFDAGQAAGQAQGGSNPDLLVPRFGTSGTSSAGFGSTRESVSLSRSLSPCKGEGEQAGSGTHPADIESDDLW
jgi:hypothetical protein